MVIPRRSSRELESTYAPDLNTARPPLHSSELFPARPEQLCPETHHPRRAGVLRELPAPPLIASADPKPTGNIPPGGWLWFWAPNKKGQLMWLGFNVLNGL